MATTEAFRDDLHACIAKLLRKGFPFTETSLINKAAEAGASSAASSIITLKSKKSRKGVRALDFLDLPAELRNRIYEYVLLNNDGPIEIENRQPNRYELWDLTLSGGRQPALTRTSRQLRQETLKLYYSMNTFTVKVSKWVDITRSEPNTTLACTWLKHIGADNASHISKVILLYEETMRETYSLNQANRTLLYRNILAEEGLSTIKAVAEVVDPGVERYHRITKTRF